MNILFGKLIIRRETLNSGLAGEVLFVETSDNKKFVLKTYKDEGNHSIDNEWNMLNILFKKGFNVPKPFEKNNNTIAMEMINGKNLGGILSENKSITEELMYEFTNLLYQLHKINIENHSKNGVISSRDFIKYEINQIKSIIGDNNICFKYISKLEKMSLNIISEKNCIIHRDYHPWNIIINEAGKMFVVDLECGYGDYRFDVAWTYTLMERSGFSDFSKTFYNQYENICGKKILDFNVFKYLTILRWLINVMNSVEYMKKLSNENDEKIEYLEKLIKNGIDQIECL